MKIRWKFEDILDIDFFNRLDQSQVDLTEEQLHRREREFFLNAKYENSEKKITASDCLKIWLQHRREQEIQGSGEVLPGNMLGDLYRLFRFILFLTGIGSGLFLGLSYFVYTGTTPLNVFLFFSIFILSQFILVLIIAIKTAMSFLPNRTSSLEGVLFLFFRKGFTMLKGRIVEKLSSQKQQVIDTFFDKRMGKVLIWPLFLTSQLFGIGFNCGVIAITLLKIATADLAFGWQSTLQIGSAKLYSFVSVIASPWSWILPTTLSHPSLSQIEGSRIILKDGIYHLTTADLTSWWPFLLLSLLFYGLMPRIVLFLFGCYMQKLSFERHLKRREFSQIIQRMRTPLFSSQAEPQQIPETGIPPSADTAYKDAPISESNMRKVVLLVPAELVPFMKDDKIIQQLQAFHYMTQDQFEIFSTYEEDSTVLQKMQRLDWQGIDGVVVMIEAWMPPLKENQTYLKKVVEVIPESVFFHILLLGRPSDELGITAAKESDRMIWHQQLKDVDGNIIIFEMQAQ